MRITLAFNGLNMLLTTKSAKDRILSVAIFPKEDSEFNSET